MKNLSLTLVACLLFAFTAQTADAKKKKTADNEDFLEFLGELDAELDKKPAAVPPVLAKVDRSKAKPKAAPKQPKSTAKEAPLPWMLRKLAETESTSRAKAQRRNKRSGHVDVSDGSANNYLQQHLTGNSRARSKSSLYDSIGSVGTLAR